MSKEGWEWLDDISMIPTTWTVDNLKEVYENYIVRYRTPTSIFYATNKRVLHDNLLTGELERRNAPNYEVYIIYPSSVDKTINPNGKGFKYVKVPYTNEIGMLNGLAVGIELFTMDEFIKILDNE